MRESGEAALVEAIRRHAFEAHGMTFPAALALDIARDAQPASDMAEPDGPTDEEDR